MAGTPANKSKKSKAAIRRRKKFEMNEKIEAATTTGVVATVTAGIEPCDNPATHDLVKWTEMECTAIYEKEPSIVNLPNQTQFEDLGYKLSKKLSESPTENELFLLYKM